jgi:hypothetical protein
MQHRASGNASEISKVRCTYAREFPKVGPAHRKLMTGTKNGTAHTARDGGYSEINIANDTAKHYQHTSRLDALAQTQMDKGEGERSYTT